MNYHPLDNAGMRVCVWVDELLYQISSLCILQLKNLKNLFVFKLGMVKPLNHFQKHKQNPYFFVIVIIISYQMMSILKINIIICRRGVPTTEAYYEPYSLASSRVFVGV